MKQLRLSYLFPLVALLLSFNCACTSSNLEVEKPQPLDQKDMLRHYADDLIIPAFKDLQTNVDALQKAAETLVTQPTLANLSALQTTWTKTHLAFQAANAYNFGPAGESGSRMRLVQEIGTFPISVLKIETNIAKGLPVPNDPNYDARGLLAIEYLIFDDQGDHQRILDGLITASRQVYLRKQIANLKAHVDDVVTGWATYRDTFINDEGTAAGSSISNLYNEFLRSYEALEKSKVSQPLATPTPPSSVEAYYSGQSLDFIRAHFAALENIWRGRDAKADGLGFDDYLKTVAGGPALVTNIEAQLTAIRQALTDLGGASSLTKQMQANSTKVQKLQTELQKGSRLFKEDMSSLLGLTVTVQ